MKQFLLKTQLFIEALVLLATITLVYAVIQPFSERWDLTRDKIYSLPKTTVEVLTELKKNPVEMMLFYPQDDPAKRGLEMFLKECKRYHSKLKYDFYDPNRRPKLAQKFNVTEPNTVVIVSLGREERLTSRINEESFTNAFLRILNPKDITVCFTAGHGEVSLDDDGTGGYRRFRNLMRDYNTRVQSIILSRDHIPEACQVVALAGPRWDLTEDEFADLDKAFETGKGVLVLIDPMDPNEGQSFVNFAKRYGVDLGKNIIVDKSSRVVGGDFLMPLVSKYLKKHEISKGLDQATFFPLVRVTQPSVDTPEGIEVLPLAMTAEGSWAETNFAALENGEASFDVKADIAGPLPIAVTVEKTEKGKNEAEDVKKRMVIVGDGDFLTNAYFDLSGNKQFGLNLIKWLADDTRFVDVKRPETKFKPLFISPSKRLYLLVSVLGIYPLLCCVAGGLFIVIRRRTS